MDFMTWLISMLNSLFGLIKPRVCEIPLKPSDIRVSDEFVRIRNAKYDEKSYNCKNKSEDFAQFLVSNNAVNVDILNVYFETKKYTHQFVVWDNLAYDPTNESMSLIYGTDLKKYLDILDVLGFNGMRIRSPYIKK